MKKIIILTLVLTLAISAGAWAGERSNLLSENELNLIEAIAHKVYPKNAKMSMVVDEDFFGRFTVIEFVKGDDTSSLRIEVYPFHARITDAESAKIGQKIGVKIVEEIEKILNETPRQALGQDRIK